jgi:lipopolysaccharide/colanic/teichoic acid biosynthesis glycosyltransferase
MEVNPMATQADPEPLSADILPLTPISRRKRLKLRPTRQRPTVPMPAVLPRRQWYVRCKSGLEFAAALVLLVLAAPLMVVAGLLVKLTSRGPVFYTQTRVGRDGRLFTIYKIRTMVHDCESLTGPRWCIPGDPRVIRAGHFLRRSHLDELPQLVNVLRGEMALIGPRPERPEFLPDLERELPNYRSRLAVRPGVTGLAQIQLAPDSDLDSVRRKLKYDLYYVENVSPWLDLGILAGTALKVLGAPWWLARGLRLVPTGAAIEIAMPVAVSYTTAVRAKKCA